MNQPSHLRIFWLVIFTVSQLFLFAQGKITVTAQDSLSTFNLNGLDFLTKLAGDTNPDHPYYTFLWIFGDGSFINGTRDSSNVAHIYERRSKQKFQQAASPRADVTIYATGNYSGGTRPPKILAPPGDPFRPASTSKATINLSGLNRIDPTPVNIDTSVIDTTKTAALRLQLNKKVRPQDTLVSIISFRQPGKVPVQDIQGQVLLFYNSKVKKANRVQKQVSQLFKSTPPPPPPVLTHGKSDFQQSLVHFAATKQEPPGTTASEGITDFQNVLAWTYDSLTADGSDERHLFAEFANDSVMWELFKNNVGDTLNFLAVMTALSNNPDILGQLPSVQNATLQSSGIQALLQSQFFTDGTFIDLSQNPTGQNLQSKIIGVSEVESAVVSAHDPNYLKLYACICPDSTEKKIAGVVEFSNDGNAPTTLVKVTLNVPEQLNMSSLETISLTPVPTVPVQPEINFTERTVTWSWPALLEPVSSAGFGHPSTEGKVVFTIALKPGFDIPQIAPTDACIVFDQNDPMCTLPVTPDQIITTAEGEIPVKLECETCKDYPDEGETTPWWCYLLWAFGILLLILIIWWVKKFFTHS